MQSNRATTFVSKVAQLIAQYYPNKRVYSIECLHSSQRTKVYEVIFQNEPSVIVRFLPSANGGSARQKFSHEKTVYGKLAEIGVPVPRILKSFESSRDVGMPYCITTKLEGQRADKVLQHTNDYEDTKILQALGTILSQIHQIEAPWAGSVLVKSAVSPHADWQQYLSSIMGRFYAGGQLDCDKKQAIQYLRQVVPSVVEPTRLTLVHNDYAFHNVFLKGVASSWEVSGILDVEWAFYGDAEWDLACFYWYLRQDYQQYRQIFENFKSGYYRNCTQPLVLCFEKVKVYTLLRMLVLSQDYPVFGGDFNEVMKWQTW